MSNPPELRANRLLAALPGSELDRLRPFLEPVELPLGKVLHEPGTAPSHAYLPTTALVAMLYVMENGATSEIALIGHEGLVGAALFMGDGTSPSRAVVQCAGHGFRLAAAKVKEQFGSNSEVQRLLLRFTQALITQMTQTAACNRHHRLEQQLCRFLLLSLDRLPGPELRMTQELIGHMLGVRREGITEAAGRLQRDGALTYARGRIAILDRASIEKRSCECYAVVRREYDRLLPPPPDSPTPPPLRALP